MRIGVSPSTHLQFLKIDLCGDVSVGRPVRVPLERAPTSKGWSTPEYVGGNMKLPLLVSLNRLLLGNK